jgi:hypothetical protein
VARENYNLTNNWTPSIYAITTSPLVLHPTTCHANGENLICSLSGEFNVSVVILAPHAGAYNFSIEGLSSWGGFTPGPTSFKAECGLSASCSVSVKLGDNTTILPYPSLHYKFPVLPVYVAAAEPIYATNTVAVTGLTVIMSSTRTFSCSSEPPGGSLVFDLNYRDLQNGKVFPTVPLSVQVIFVNL